MTKRELVASAPGRESEAIPRLCIVSGPSSAGKSTFIASSRMPELTGVDTHAAILFPPKLRGVRALESDALLHYNLLRPMHRAWKRNEDRTDAYRFDRDPRWRDALDLPAVRRAVVLVVDRETLLDRVRARKAVETGRDAEYPSDDWIEIYERVDLDLLYAAWRRELRQHRIPFVEVDAGDSDYGILRGG